MSTKKGWIFKVASGSGNGYSNFQQTTSESKMKYIEHRFTSINWNKLSTFLVHGNFVNCTSLQGFRNSPMPDSTVYRENVAEFGFGEVR